MMSSNGSSAGAGARAAADSLADLQRQIRQNADESRAALADLAAWEAGIKQTGDQVRAKKAANAAPLPPVRGSTTTASAPAPAQPAVPRIKSADYRAWDSLDVDALLQQMDNTDHEQYHAEAIAAKPSPATPAPERNPDLAKIEKDTGNVYFKKAKYAKAIQHYARAIALDPTDAVFYLNRAAAYLKLDQNEAAEQDCDAALQRDPKSVKALFRRATARRATGNTAGAIADLERALVLEPMNKSVKDELAVLRPPKPAVVPEPAPAVAAPVVPKGPPKRRRLVIREIESGKPAPADMVAEIAPSSAPAAAPVEKSIVTSEPVADPLFKEVATKRMTEADAPVPIPAPSAGRKLVIEETTSNAVAAPELKGRKLVIEEAVSAPARPAAAVRNNVVKETASGLAPAANVKSEPDTTKIMAASANAPPRASDSPATPAAIVASAEPSLAAPSSPRPSTPPRPTTPLAKLIPMPATDEPLHLSAPTAAFEFDRDIKVLRERGLLDVSRAHVDARAVAYLRQITPSKLPTLFRASIDATQISVFVCLLDALPEDDATAPKLAFNVMYYLTQCPRFAIAARMLDAGDRVRVKDVTTRLQHAFGTCDTVPDPSVPAARLSPAEKVARVRAAWDAALDT
ncbi:RNA polymerase II-associated protein 3 [Allomyces arbusculus]|nr:RNA polymerase II-associated protein 3 [Allomyces arbusculus]